MNKYIIGKCNMCGIDMIVGTPIEDKVVCHNCYCKYEKDKIDFLQELSNKQKKTIADLETKLTLHEQSNKVLNDQLNQATEHIGDLNDKLAGLQQENKKLKQCFDKLSENCTFDELREIILTGEENSNEIVIKMLNEQVETLEAELVLARNTSINTNKMEIIHLQAENIELKQQLAEHNEYFASLSCKDFNEFQDFISTFMLTPHEEQTLIRELKQQLDEKEQRVRKLQYELEWAKQDLNECAVGLEQKHNQDKISFCVEQLEKVKENLIEDLFDLYRSPCLIYETYGDEYDSAIQEAINNTIDNQIKQLTHQHKIKEKDNGTNT